eukprot:m.246946 g.246946  ORF g.246946 m.246946 type:complete len:80 (-) comp15858_c0_seq8:600-839(-)
MLMYANLMQGEGKWCLALSLHLVLLGAAATENKPNLRLCCRVAQRGTKVDSKQCTQGTEGDGKPTIVTMPTCGDVNIMT